MEFFYDVSLSLLQKYNLYSEGKRILIKKAAFKPHLSNIQCSRLL